MFRRPIHHVLGLVATSVALAAPAALADSRIERELALEPGGHFTLETDSGAVQVRGADRTGARILVTSPRDDVEERYSFTFDERDGSAVVRVEKRSPLSGWLSGGDRLRFEIELPHRVAVDLRTAGGSIDVRGVAGEVDARTSGGAIDARDLGGETRLDTSGGSIHVEQIAGGLMAHTSGGAIRVDGVSGDAKLETSGGSIDAAGIGGRLDARTSGGPVRASFEASNASGGSLSTSGGGIRVLVDPTAGLDIDASASGGRVTVDLPLTVLGPQSRTRVRGTLNGGGALLKLRSSGGSIRLQSL